MSDYSSQTPQGPAYPPPPHSYPAQPQPATHNMAIVSLIFGILGVVGICPGLGSIIALIAGYSARKSISAEPQRYGGSGLATAGIITGWIGVAFMCLGLCAFMVWFLFFGGMLMLGNILESSFHFIPTLLALI